MPSKRQEIDTAEFAQAVGLLVRRMRAATGSHDLSLTEFAVLSRLDREGPATTAELARAERVRPQSMGATVAALEEVGMVERRPHPTDGRQMHVALSAHGAAVLKSRKDAKRTWLAQEIAQLDEQDQTTLLEAGRIIRRLAEQ
jgi:DNA-binding MarR family transcriptional regulator